MPNIIPTLIKVVLVVLFIQNMGGWNFVQKAIWSPADSPTLAQVNQIEKFTLDRLKLAEQKIAAGQIYSPDNYFGDLLAIEEYCYGIGLKSHWFNRYVNSLQSLVMKQAVDGQFSHDQISIAAQRYRNEMVDDRLVREGDGLSFSEALPKILSWLWHSYLANLFIGFLWILVWFYQKNKTLMIRNPLSFILAVIAYPIVIAIAWYQGFRDVGRNVYGEAVARRFKDKVFDLLSEDEVSVVKRFAAGHINRHHLEAELSCGRTANRSLSYALVVTAFLVLVPQSFTMSDVDQPIGHNQEQVVDRDSSGDSSPDLQTRHSAPAAEIICSLPEICFVDIIVPLEKECLRHTSIVDEIDHIPLNGYYLFFNEIFNNFKKGNYCEKSNYHNIVFVS